MLLVREDDGYDNFDPSFNKHLRIETWTLFSIGAFLTLLRLYATASRAGGPRNWLIDEYLAILAFCLYLILIVTLNVIAENGGSNLFPVEQLSTFTKADIRKRILNSKIVVVSEQAMLCTIYTLKACLLVMYMRLTTGLRTRRAVNALSIYAFVGWLATEICFFTTCMPFNQYWAIPPKNSQCATLQYYGVVQGTFNISSDVLMLGIPISIVIRLQAPWRKKLVVGVVLSMGIFVILAAIMCKVHNLTNVYSSAYMFWYTREASVALYVANMPMIWPLLREWFPFLNRFGPSKSNSNAVSGMTPGTGGAISGAANGTGMHGTRFGTVTTSVYHTKRRESHHSSGGNTDEIALNELKANHTSDGMGSTDHILDEERDIDLPISGIKVHQVLVIEESVVHDGEALGEQQHAFEFDSNRPSRPAKSG
ncbi:hypothetical protein TD95_004333 [Thielaviopsis punctulata]|uniref:Rhodopsin domain-containing protein n=1 Tax=Thielaviopsis punctulata TaxID=72032 RepID=A0A0F4ZL36_9PEZI|nr:hypothetical protein TD95_004333 [Thielaviopsis punctulata]